MAKQFTRRQAAERIEQFGDDLVSLVRALDSDAMRFHSADIILLNDIPGQDELEAVAGAFRALGSRLSSECDAAEDAATLASMRAA